jgi:MoxR-like ATPase
MKIIVKRGISTSRENTTGFVKPIFKFDDNEYNIVNDGEFPNNGNIFITAGFDKFEVDSFYEIEFDKLQDSNKYDSDLDAYNSGTTYRNPSLKIVNFHRGISKLSPDRITPIFENKFNSKSNKLLSSEGIRSDVFFLKNTELNKICGPFKRNGTDLEAASFRAFEDEFEDDDNFLEFIDIYSQYDGSIVFEINLDKVSNFIISDNEGSEFLVDFRNFVDNKIGTPIDFTPITQLHEWAIEKLKLNAPKIATTLNEIKNIVSTGNNTLDKIKWDNYVSHLEDIQKSQEDVDKLVKLLNDKKFIDLDVDNSIIEKLNSEIEKVKSDRDFKSEEIIQLKTQNEELENELLEAEKKPQNNNSIDENLFPHLFKALGFPEKVKEIEDFVVSNKKLSDLDQEYWKLVGKKESLDKQVDELKKAEVETASIIKGITSGFKTDAKEYTARLAEVKIYTDLLNGIEILPNSAQIEVSKTIQNNITSLNSELNTAKLYVLEIQKRLKKQDRDLAFNEVANLVITINQTFITIIAGAPGVGKTSLVEKLARSYGLDESFGYLEIPCAKGWTSSKDLIGFFNPLTNKFQPSKTKLKDALSKSEANPNSPYIILLDEANLSPIEHYWSDFIKLADANYPRKIKISDNEEIKFGEGFKFVATINHDHTTEALSNRLIDRAAIIQIEKPSVINEISEISNEIEDIFDFFDLQNLFTTTSKWKSEEGSIREILKNIKNKLEFNGGIIVSPRKEIAIIKYCKVATGLLEGNSYKALDYAISQNVLPLLNGRGENFEIMLRALKDILSDKEMAKSEKVLNKIIERGKELKHFRYIYY